MKALAQKAVGQLEVAEVPVPDLQSKPTYVKVKVQYVALNPTDWKGSFNRDLPGALIGCDVSGVVEEVGSEVKTKVSPGDKIAGMVHGFNPLNPQNAAFAEYCLVQDGIFIKVPDTLDMKEAATLGVGITTVGQGLYQSLQIPWPGSPAKEPFPLLIYGGSTATGSLAIQFAKKSGATVITVSSPRNFDLLKSLGADTVYDYNDPTSAEQIRKATHNQLHLAFDCISEGNSFAFCAAALSSDSQPENHYSALLPVKDFPRSDVNTRNTMAYSALGEPMSFGGPEIPAQKEHYEIGKRMWATAQELFEKGELKVHPVDLKSGGLERITDGLMDLKNNKVSGKKLVYQVA